MCMEHHDQLCIVQIAHWQCHKSVPVQLEAKDGGCVRVFLLVLAGATGERQITMLQPGCACCLLDAARQTKERALQVP